MRFFVIWLFLNCYATAIAQSWQKTQLVPFDANCSLINGVFFKDTGYVISSGGVITETTDFFQSTKNDTQYHHSSFSAISFANRQVGYITCPYIPGSLLKTVDGGISWNPFPDGGATGISVGDVLFFSSADTGYSLSSMINSFLYTNNGGLSWNDNTINDINCKRFFQIKQQADSALYLLCNDNEISPAFGYLHLLKSTNYGISWSEVISLNTFGWGDFELINDSTILFVTNGLMYLYDINNNILNTVMSNFNQNQLSDLTQAISFISPDTGFVAYTSIVYKTSNGGNTWIRTDFTFDGNDPGNSIKFIKAISANKVVVGCFNGNIYKTETGGGVWAGINETEEAPTFNLYPNPTAHQLTIQTTGYHSSYQLTTTTGQLLLQSNVTQPNFTIDVSILPPGLYFVQLTNGQQRAVRKFVKQ